MHPLETAHPLMVAGKMAAVSLITLEWAPKKLLIN